MSKKTQLSYEKTLKTVECVYNLDRTAVGANSHPESLAVLQEFV